MDSIETQRHVRVSVRSSFLANILNISTKPFSHSLFGIYYNLKFFHIGALARALKLSGGKESSMAVLVMEELESFSQLDPKPSLKEALALLVTLCSIQPLDESILAQSSADTIGTTIEEIGFAVARLQKICTIHSQIVLTKMLQNGATITAVDEIFSRVPAKTEIAKMIRAVKAWLNCGKTLDISLLDNSNTNAADLDGLVSHVTQYSTLATFEDALHWFGEDLRAGISSFIRHFKESLSSVVNEGSELHMFYVAAKEKVEKFRLGALYSLV